MAVGLGAPHMPVRYSPRGLSSSVWVCCSSSACGRRGARAAWGRGEGKASARAFQHCTSSKKRTTGTCTLCSGDVKRLWRERTLIFGQCMVSTTATRSRITTYRDGLASNEQRKFVGEVVAVIVQQVVRLGREALRPQLADHVAHQGGGQQRGAVGTQGARERGAGARRPGAQR